MRSALLSSVKSYAVHIGALMNVDDTFLYLIFFPSRGGVGLCYIQMFEPGLYCISRELITK